MTPIVTVLTMSDRAVQNFQTTTVEVGLTSTHHCNGPMPDAKRRTSAPGLMNATGETLGSPPAINVATVSANHEHIQTVTSNAAMPISRQAWVRYCGAAAIRHPTVRPPTGRGRDSAVPKMPRE
jgi:hypothetical protein